MVNTKLAGDGVGLFSPAGLGKAQGVSWLSALAIAVVLGGLVGAGLAYWLDARKQAFSNWLEPEALLRVPAIAEIPDFTRERVTSKLPVLHSPGTESAEAFRLLASSVSPPRETMKKAGRTGSRQRDEWALPAARLRVQVGGVRRRRVRRRDDDADGEHGVRRGSGRLPRAGARHGRRAAGPTRLLLGRAITVDGADSTAEGLSNMLRHRASPETIQRVMGTGAGGRSASSAPAPRPGGAATSSVPSRSCPRSTRCGMSSTSF